MMTTVYGVCLVISILVWIYVAGKDYQKIDSYFSVTCVLIPVVILGYWLKTMVMSAEAAMLAFCFIYLDSTILLTIYVLAMMRTLGFNPKPIFNHLLYVAAFAHLFLVWFCAHNRLYISTIYIQQTEMGSATLITDGPLKIIHVIYLVAMFILIVGLLLTAYHRNGTYSRRTMALYAGLSMTGLIIYANEAVSDAHFSLLPCLYVLAEVIIVANYDITLTHDVSTILASHQIAQGTRGYMALDKNNRFLSCNEKMFEFLPELRTQAVDGMLPDNGEAGRICYSMIYSYEKQGINSQKYTKDGMTYVAEINPFFIRKNGKNRGYIFDIRDATEEQKALDIMSSYNESLNEQVKLKTDNIIEIQSKIVSGMANMIENRDNNTGGHVKRTSDVIRIVVDEIRRQGIIPMDDQFARDIVRAAPMHDLGKLMVEDSILNKPGKLTDEEYEIMKRHSVDSGEMVMILLDGVMEEHLVEVAYNVARYHHERWDGLGYPEKLVGSMIPIEARIMAVVDVYDALVSERIYKKAMPFDVAARIMCEGMGTQFDPNMLSVFLGCREQLEEYYRDN